MTGYPDGWTFEVATMATVEPDGGDTTILLMPDAFFVDGALLAVQFGHWLQKLAMQQAFDLGERLHHAEFVITSDPAVVKERGILEMHGECDSCQADVERVLRYMSNHPDELIVVGQLFWQ